MVKKMKKYKLLGRSHSAVNEEGDRTEYKTGDMVPLTDAQYESFSDKFEQPKAEAQADAKEGLAPGEEKTTATEPKSDGNDDTAIPAPNAQKTTPQDGAAGAGAAANSSNTAQVPSGEAKKGTTSAGSGVPGNTASKQ